MTFIIFYLFINGICQNTEEHENYPQKVEVEKTKKFRAMGVKINVF